MVPNSKRLKISGDFLGTALFTEVLNETGLSHPEMSLVSSDKTAEIIFKNDHKVGKTYTMVTTQQELVVKTYEKPPIKKSISGQQYFRGEVKESQKQLFQFYKASNAISFDQSYYTRTIGQIEIQRRLEEKYGPLISRYKLATGAGFGAIQAIWLALGWKAEDLQYFWCTGLRKSVKIGAAKIIFSFFSPASLNPDFERRTPDRMISALREAFTVNKEPLKIKDLKIDVFIPISDVSGRVMVFNKEKYKDMPLYVVAACSSVDPIFFNSSPLMKGMGLLNGDISKNNDVFLRHYNKTMNITSVGCPVRYYDKGSSKMNRSSMSLKMQDQKHETDLLYSESIINPGIRYECKPIDEVYQFSTSEDSLDKALNSGDIDV